MDEAFVPQAVARALGVRESPGQPLTETVKNFLREKQFVNAWGEGSVMTLEQAIEFALKETQD